MTNLEVNRKIAEIKGLNEITIGAIIIWDKTSVRTIDRNYNWAESISDAFELFEEMPIGVRLQSCYGDEDDGWGSTGYRCDIIGMGIYCCEPTAPLAIAKAWLKWKEM